MNQLNRSSQGMALITGMIILAVLSLAGLAAMQFARTDTRISTNVKTSKQAFHLAEAGIQHAGDHLKKNLVNWDSFAHSTPTGLGLTGNALGGVGSYTVTVQDGGGELRKVIATATVGGGVSKLEAIFQPLTTPVFPWVDAMHGCDGVAFNSNPSTDSYDSRVGDYAAQPQRFNGDISTSNPDADIVLNSNAQLYGDVMANRDIVVGSGAGLHGNVNAGRNFTIPNGQIFSNADHTNALVAGGSVTMSSTGLIGTDASNPVDVYATGGNLAMENANNRIYGDVNVSGSVTGSADADIYGNVNATGAVAVTTHGATTSVPVQPPFAPYIGSVCDPLDVATLVTGRINNTVPTSNLGSYALRGNRTENFTADGGVWQYDGFDLGSNTHFNLSGPASQTILVNGDLLLQSQSTLFVDNVDVTLVVTGNIDLASNAQFELRNGSKLTIYVAGSMVDNSNSDWNATGVPADLRVFSSNTGTDGVQLRSNNTFNGTVYAPLTEVVLASNTDFFGSVRGRLIKANSSHSFHYDEALGDLGLDAGDGSVRVISWREVR